MEISMDTFYSSIEYFIYFNISFFIRMVLLFTVMMKYYNYVDKDSTQWRVVKLVWYPIAVVFALSDVIYNWYSSVTFWDKPATFNETVSYRMDRYIKQYKNRLALTWLEKWRYYFALGLCKVLSFSDPKHCGDI